jgi:hypothetical protein
VSEAKAGGRPVAFFRVEFRFHADRAWAEETAGSFGAYMERMVVEGEAGLLQAMPFVAVEAPVGWVGVADAGGEDDPAEELADEDGAGEAAAEDVVALLVRYDRLPGAGPWNAVESAVELARAAFPALLDATWAVDVRAAPVAD